MKKWILGVLLLFPLFTLAQTDRSYYYDSIVYNFEVNPDTTVQVEEVQTYAFNGVYHQAVRTIPHKGVSLIDNIQVFDGATGEPLTYSNSRLDKNDPASWGYYTTYRENGQTYIEWYYSTEGDLNPASHSWVLRYTLHGAISFYKDHDELYWNLFTSYDVPVGRVEATVRLPGVNTLNTASFYTTSNLPHTVAQPDDRTYQFVVENIPSQEDVTFAAGWQKGLVDQSAYWRDFFSIYFEYLLALLIFVSSIVCSVIYWQWVKHRNRGRGTIVPQYEPPQNLRPAMMDVILDGHVSRKAWAATVVDLAVRGYVTITPDELDPMWKSKGFWLGAVAVFVAMAVSVLFMPVPSSVRQTAILAALLAILLVVLLQRFGVLGRVNTLQLQPKDYIVEPNPQGVPANLEDYEQKFLDALFKIEGNKFSTKTLRKSQTQARALYLSLEQVKKDLQTETALDTKGFLIAPGGTGGVILVGLAILFLCIAFVFSVSEGAAFPHFILALSIVLSLMIVYGVVKVKPRLNREGSILRENVLGFKMYLETAERYRMQNLTPDIFEKYLPYAIVFGVEKKWAKAFDGMTLPPPQWYAHGAYGAAAMHGNAAVPSFSASAFSNSFSSSFASAFSSAGGGGASGGGGGAGGGGGGGGGGAS